MIVLAAIGSKALYLLFVWLLSAAGAAWLADRKGYTERVGLTFGLVLTFVGFIIVLLLPGRPGSAWKVDGPLPRRSRPGPRSAASGAVARVDAPEHHAPTAEDGAPAAEADRPGPPAG